MHYSGQPIEKSAATTITAANRLLSQTKPVEQDWTTPEPRPLRKSSRSNLRVVLSPNGTFVGPATGTEQQLKRGRELASAIRQRIELRLLGRVRELAIHVADDTVYLEGRCATFYTKQLAQHSALAVLEDEQLVNNIVVALP
jgi:hypothetical protein